MSNIDAQELWNLREKLAANIRQLKAMRLTYTAEVEYDEDVQIDTDAGIRSLEDALRRIDKLEIEPEEHANSSAANYRDYAAEERATTDR